MPLRPWCFKRIPPGAVEPILLSRNPKVKEKTYELRDEFREKSLISSSKFQIFFGFFLLLFPSNIQFRSYAIFKCHMNFHNFFYYISKILSFIEIEVSRNLSLKT